MNANPLRVQMLGEFSIFHNEKVLRISERSRKLCLLLAVLIWERSRPIPCEELAGLLQIDQHSGSLNTLKALIHRARTCLDQLEPGAGRQLLLSRGGCYQWNPEFPIILDAETFAQLGQESKQENEQRLTLELKALELYQGDLLPALSGQPWAAARARELRELYLSLLLDALPVLSVQDRWEEMDQLTCAALPLAPCQEELCRWRMEILSHLNRQHEAVRVYEDFQDQLLAQLGLLPSDSLRELYWQLQPAQDARSVSPANLLERLQEPPRPGALMCNFDFFRAVCHSTARMAERSGNSLHVALISVTGPDASALSRNSLERAMDNLEGVIRSHMRRGDTAARCSASQFVLLLPWASYKNGLMICDRISRAFARQFPHSPAQLQFSVQPLLSSG